jgi:hypothetical protein
MNIEEYIIQQIKNDLKDFKINQNVIDEMEDLYQNKESNPCSYIKSLTKIKIENGILIVNFDEKNDFCNRCKSIEKLFERCFKKYSKEIPDVTLYVITTDGFAYYHQHLPFLILAKPLNEFGILLPDDSFINNKIEEQSYDWDETRKIILNNCNYQINKKISKIYFRGVNNGNKKHNLRALFKNEVQELPEFKIEISNKMIPIYNFCKYKYLLNLPGGQPWSYRFKYLFLMNSLVIDIQLLQKYKKCINSKWVNFFDSFLEEDEDYIPIKVIYEEGKPLNHRKILLKVAKIYDFYQKNPKKYNKIVKSGYEKISKINNEAVDFAIFNIIKEYSKNLKNEI